MKVNDPEGAEEYRKSLIPFIERAKRIEKARRDGVEKTPATLADIEDAINEILYYIREAVHWMEIDNYKILPKENNEKS